MSYFIENTTVEEGKAQLLLETKSYAFQLLKPFDWYVTRKAEDNTAIPADVVTYRQEVKAVSAQRCTLINACSDVAELEALIIRPYWDYATQFDVFYNMKETMKYLKQERDMGIDWTLPVLQENFLNHLAMLKPKLLSVLINFPVIPFRLIDQEHVLIHDTWK